MSPPWSQYYLLQVVVVAELFQRSLPEMKLRQWEPGAMAAAAVVNLPDLQPEWNTSGSKNDLIC